MGNLLIVIVIGFLVGLVARFLMPGRDPGGFIVTIVVGIVGSVIATYGGQALGLYAPGQVAGFIGSVVGAIILLVLLRLIRRG
jgi:uncharacterized membrane protein YeaQ/YmgE (transglycosylase-associated protein family)